MAYSKLHLLSCDLDSTNQHCLLFNSKGDLENYFESRSQKSFNCVHLRGENFALSVEGNYLELSQYNYLFYDENFTGYNKRIYGFIDEVIYINEKASKIIYHVDVMTTYYFDYQVQQSYIEREHFKQDVYSSIPDTIEPGELQVREQKNFVFDGAYFVFCSNDISVDDTTSGKQYQCKIGNYILPCLVIYFPAGNNGSSKLGEFIQTVSNKGRADRIISCFYTPLVKTPDFELTQESGDIGSFTVINSINTESLSSIISCQFDCLITPKYKKIAVAPYSYIRVQDSITGQYVLLDYNKFLNRNMEFEIRVDISETPSIRVIPKNYDGENLSYSNSLVVNCSTSMPVVNNVYASYFMRNQEINNLNKTFGVVGAVQQIASNPLNLLNDINAGVSAFEKITMINAADRQQQKNASQISGLSDGACQRLNFENCIKISVLMPDQFHEELIYKYWNMFGYPVHEYDIPNFRIDNRDHCYVKLIEPNITFNGVPVKHQQQIISFYERGITFWKDKDNYRRYYIND